MTGINFDLLLEEQNIIMDIVMRAMLREEIKILSSPVSLAMDITAVHKNDIELDLKGFLKSPDDEFFYDIIHIIAHIDRKTGKLKKGYIPLNMKR